LQINIKYIASLTVDSRRGPEPVFNWISLVQLISRPAHVIAAQQGCLQRHSLYPHMCFAMQPVSGLEHALYLPALDENPPVRI
jgi:hypothetical protein